jgi:S1-C subfamily serine protease
MPWNPRTRPRTDATRPARAPAIVALLALAALALSIGGTLAWRDASARAAAPVRAAAVAPAVPATRPSSAAVPAPGEAAPSADEDSAADEAPAVSATARRLYEATRPRLLQVRTLLKDQDSQSSVGSGSLVGAGGLVLTNYHVVSQVALQPQRYRLTFAMADGQKGPLQLIAVDVLHDLALVRMTQPPASLDLAGRGVLTFRDAARPLAHGESIYSLGNPLDVGFAVVEGTYNGLVERRFLPQILFSGALSPGMSGGPVLDDHGRVVGVNVATMRNGSLVSFLVPATYAQALVARGASSPPMTGPIDAEIARQLLQHQADLTARFVALPWREANHAHYLVPVPQEEFMRCWGATSPAESKGLEFERSVCQMDSDIFVSGALQTGNLSVRHEVYDGRRLGALRFNEQYARSFANENMGHKTRDLTAPRCKEDFVESGGLPMRTVMCLRAYRQLKGLFDVTVLTTSVDASTEGVQGRFDARGVSFDNAMVLARHYLQGFGWKPAK